MIYDDLDDLDLDLELENEEKARREAAIAEITCSPAYQKKPLDPKGKMPVCTPWGHDWHHSDSYIDREIAKRMCHECPLEAMCLANAIEQGEEDGIFGGKEMGKGPKTALPEEAVCEWGHVGQYELRNVFATVDGKRKRVDRYWLCGACDRASVAQDTIPARKAV